MWLGRPGELVRLPDPDPDIEAALMPPWSATTLLSGAIVVQQGVKSPRRFSVPWRWITEAQMHSVAQFTTGVRGRGPWVLITELDTNRLTANQSSGTEAQADTEGFAVSHGTVASSTAQAYQDSRSLLWTLPGSDPGVDPFLSLTWPGSAYGFPVVANEDYAFSCRVSADSASFVLAVSLRWYTKAGALISTNTWAMPSVSGSLSSYVYASISALAPPTAAYVLPTIDATTMVTSGHVSLDHAQLEMGPVSTAWVPGMGLPRVAIEPLTLGYPYKGDNHLGTVNFVEVG